MRARAEGALGLGEAAASGRQAAFDALTERAPSASPSGGAADEQQQPGWARALKRQQDARHHQQIVAHTLRDGDRGGASATPDIKEKED
jgi:type IV secretion system protein TrbL